MQSKIPMKISFPLELQRRADKLLKCPKYLKKTEFDSTPKIIKCFNHPHRLNQSYDKWSSLPLSSSSWVGRKSIGKEFTFLPFKSPSSTHWWKKSSEKPPSFSDLGLSDVIVRELNLSGFKIPTNIQQSAIPIILSGEGDIVINSETGNGKTLTFLTPILQSVLKDKEKIVPFNSPKAVIVTPSRELAIQISKVASSLGKGLDLDVRCVLGGSIRKKAIHGERSNVDILVGTVGGLFKLFKAGYLKASEVRFAVFDEADTLFDETFADRSSGLLAYIFRGRTKGDTLQTLFVGATLAKYLENSVDSVLDTDNLIKISTHDLHRIPKHISQRFIRTSKIDKFNVLKKVIETDIKKKRHVLIFSNKCSTADWLCMSLNEEGIETTNLTKNVPYKTRHTHVDKFESGNAIVLSASDLASRGLDFEGKVHHVINYDFPLNMSDYIHRIGRVGRTGALTVGKVTNLVSTQLHVDLVQKIEKSLRLNKVIPNVNSNIVKIIEKAHNKNHSS